MNEPSHLVPTISHPFRAMRRKIDELEERWSRRQEMKEEEQEWKAIQKQLKKERKERERKK